MTRMESRSSASLLNTTLLLGVMVLFVAHYLAGTRVEWFMDDWGYLAKAARFETVAQLLGHGGLHPHRPVLVWALLGAYGVVGDQPAAFLALGLVTYALFLALAGWLVWKLTDCLQAVWLFCLILALLPNFSDWYHWPNMILVGSLAIGYLLAALGWVQYLREGRGYWLAIGAVGYTIGLGTYEIGVGLPFAFALLLGRQQWKRVLNLWPYAAGLVVYGLWRVTNVLGFGRNVFYRGGHHELAVAAWQLKRNALDLFHWWAGDHMGAAMREGFNGFASLDPSTRWIILLMNLITVGWVIGWTRRLEAGAKSQRSLDDTLARSAVFPRLRVAAFALGWIAVTMGLSLVSYTAARLNFLPAVGVALLLALGLTRVRIPEKLDCLALLVFLGLIANQGTARNWVQAGLFNRRLYEHLCAHAEQWQGKEVVLLNTEDVRQRLTPGLLSPLEGHVADWSYYYYRNASLLRGFVPAAMLGIIQPRGDKPYAVVDTECGAYMDGVELLWHERFDPSKPHRTPMDRVWIVDVFDVVSTKPE